MKAFFSDLLARRRLSGGLKSAILRTALTKLAGLLVFAMSMALSTSAHASSLRVISYNVWGVPHITPDRAERIRRIGDALAALKPDVVALQEVWLKEDADLLTARLAAAGLTHQRFFGAEAKAENAGLLLVARYPMEDVKFVPFRAGRKAFIPWHVDYMAHKGFALARVITPDGPVNVVNTHLQSSYRFYHYRATRLAQALQLAGGLAATSHEAPMVLVGDFNDTPSSLSFRALSARAGLRTVSEAFNLDAALLRSGNRGQLRLVDVREILTEEIALDSGARTPLSDHPCVLVDLEIKGCADCSSAATPWKKLRTEVGRAIDGDIDETRAILWLLRGIMAMLVALMVLAWRRRRPRRAWLRLAFVGGLLALAGWCIYAAFDWAPDQLEMLAHEKRNIADGRLSDDS